MVKKYQLLGSVGPNYSLTPPVVRRSGSHDRQPLKSVPPSKIEISSPLAKGEWGGVIGIGAKIKPSQQGNGVDMVTRGNDEGVIKVALLFVDKVDKPANNLMSFGEDDSPDITGLGLGQQSIVTYSEGLTYEQNSTYVWNAYRLLNEREPGRWSLWPQYDTPAIPNELLTPDVAFQLELTNGLIVPHPSTPYEDMLLFKDRHRDELRSVREHLEELAIKLSKEGDVRAINFERERFDNSLADYLKKARHSNGKMSLAKLTKEFDWSAAARGAFGGGGIAVTTQGFTLTAAAAAIGNGLLAGLSIKSVAGLKETPSPFRYIARIEKEYGG